MAINKIAGEILESNLIRTADLAFNTDLLYLDVDNGRIGVNTSAPGQFALDVNGNTRITGNQTITGDLIVQGNTTTVDSTNLVVEDNIITLNENASSATDAGLMINRTGENNAVFYWDEVRNKFRVGTTTSDGSTRTDLTSVSLARLQVATPTADDDAAHKKYIDDSGQNQGLFRGHIVDIDDDDPDDVLYNIFYEDGDAEDMNEEECRASVDLYMKLESGEINE